MKTKVEEIHGVTIEIRRYAWNKVWSVIDPTTEDVVLATCDQKAAHKMARDIATYQHRHAEKGQGQLVESAAVPARL